MNEQKYTDVVNPRAGLLVAFKRINGEIIIGVMIQLANGKLVCWYPKNKTWGETTNSELVEIREPNNILHPNPILDPEQIGYTWEKAAVLWKKTEVVELTMNQIAEKFGIPVEQLKIRK